MKPVSGAILCLLAAPAAGQSVRGMAYGVGRTAGIVLGIGLLLAIVVVPLWLLLRKRPPK